MAFICQYLLGKRSINLPEGHSYAWCPLPPQLWQIISAMQSRLIWPTCWQVRHTMSRYPPPPPPPIGRNPPPLSSRAPDLGQSLARWPDILHKLHTGSFWQSRARWPVFLQFLHALSLVQSTAMWPCLKQLLHSFRSPGGSGGAVQSLARCPALPQVWQIPSFGQLPAIWPGSRQFQQRDFVVHSEAICPGRPQLWHIATLGHSRAKWPGRLQFLQRLLWLWLLKKIKNKW